MTNSNIPSVEVIIEETHGGPDTYGVRIGNSDIHWIIPFGELTDAIQFAKQAKSLYPGTPTADSRTEEMRALDLLYAMVTHPQQPPRHAKAKQCYFTVKDFLDQDHTPQQTAAILDVLAERQRQIEVKGFTPDHDDTLKGGQLPLAAACYALSSAGWAKHRFSSWWPFDRAAFKSGPVRKGLIKAAALIIAEIERIDRAKKRRVAGYYDQ